MGNPKQPFNGSQSWPEKVLDADRLWQQVSDALQAEGIKLPQTPRRPDIRLIINNISGNAATFHNPGDHANSKEENIPATGEKTAAMVMVKGETLEEQYANAAALYERYNLGKEGLSATFIEALRTGAADDLVAEAYGPAPFNGQADKLVPLDWVKADGSHAQIEPVKGKACAFGARAAASETVFRADIPIYVQGTGTVAELVESGGMYIAVSEDWQTGAVSTRPIVASVAETFYGKHTKNIPAATVNTDGLVQSIDLMDGRIIELPPPSRQEPQGPGGPVPS